MNNDYILTVGLEIHVELETKTKMFCSCPNDPFFAEPNVNVCPVCYGLPGALPVTNKEAVMSVLRFGSAISADIAKHTFWARKNYFYPDLPKGYQISQSTEPLISGGHIAINGKSYRLNHAHLEEDAGKLMHVEQDEVFTNSATGENKTLLVSKSLVNYNRAGVPLLEIVTEPDFHTASDAKEFCQELQRIMRTLKISSADMEKGRMRCEANISVAKEGEVLGTKVEVKNINSFRAVEKAIDYEYNRQVTALENEERLNQETRNWDDSAGKTVVMRTKETSADYRYFPEPDLPAVVIEGLSDFVSDVLPDQKRAKLAELGLNQELIQAIVDKDGYEVVTRLAVKDAALAIEAGKLFLALPSFGKLAETEQLQVIKLKKEKGLSSDTLKNLVSQSFERGVPIESLISKNDSIDITTIAQEVIANNPGPVAEYKAGKEVVFQFLVGQVMAKTKGMANIQEVRDELKQALNN